MSVLNVVLEMLTLVIHEKIVTMYCLHCGDCCLTMCPISDEKCPKLIQKDTFYFCGIYANRPKQCENHDFPTRLCPIGMSKLGLHYPDNLEKIRDRIATGYSIIHTEEIAWQMQQMQAT